MPEALRRRWQCPIFPIVFICVFGPQSNVCASILRRALFFPMRREAQAARSVWGENLWFEAINIVFGRIKGHRRCSGSNGRR